MPQKIEKPSLIEACGTKPKLIEEFFGKINSSSDQISIAKMTSPQGWEEPGQCPEFDEYTLVLKGELLVKTKKDTLKIAAGQAVLTKAGEWVQYSTPGSEGAEYMAVCLPAFSPETVNRDES